MSVWVADASPLLFLAKIQRLELLERASAEVLTPRAVLDEVLALNDSAAADIQEATRSWLRVVAIEDTLATEILLAARLRGDVPSLRAEIDRLRDEGFYASEALISAVLEAAGETVRE